MKRIRLTVAYDGTRYAGWQVQPNAVAVQQVLDEAISDLLKMPVHTIGASRTDAGVHALGNIAVFDTPARMPADKYAFALNTRLPEDIRIQKSEEVPADFHPRFCSTVKTYEYRILNRTFPDPTRRLNSVHVYGRLNLEEMQKAAKRLEGTHDFKGFATENPQVKTTVRTIYHTELFREEDMIHFRITGNGFLYNMVRIIVGTLLEIGKGQMTPEDIDKILEAGDRRLAGPTARAQGLTLIEIRYPGEAGAPDNPAGKAGAIAPKLPGKAEAAIEKTFGKAETVVGDCIGSGKDSALKPVENEDFTTKIPGNTAEKCENLQEKSLTS